MEPEGTDDVRYRRCHWSRRGPAISLYSLVIVTFYVLVYLFSCPLSGSCSKSSYVELLVGIRLSLLLSARKDPSEIWLSIGGLKEDISESSQTLKWGKILRSSSLVIHHLYRAWSKWYDMMSASAISRPILPIRIAIYHISTISLPALAPSNFALVISWAPGVVVGVEGHVRF